MRGTVGVKACAVAVLAMPAVLCGQMTGTSHPEEIAITTSAEGIQQPVVYQGTLTAKPIAAVAAAPVGSPASAATTPQYVPTPVLKVRVEERSPALTAVVPTVGSAAATAAMREDIPGVVSDVDAGVVTRVRGAANELPAGTMLKMRLNQELSTVTTLPGARFDGALTEAVERDGKVLLPAGSVLSGVVTDVHGGKRISGPAFLHLRPVAITLPDGTHYKIGAHVIDTDANTATKVDNEGTILRRDHAGKTLAAMSLTTGSGAAAGGVIAGVPGALVGAGVGAGVSTALWLKQEHQTGLPARTKIVFELTESLIVQ